MDADVLSFVELSRHRKSILPLLRQPCLPIKSDQPHLLLQLNYLKQTFGILLHRVSVSTKNDSKSSKCKFIWDLPITNVVKLLVDIFHLGR